MADQSQNLFVTAPQLLCLDMSETSLTFSHFGNVSHYNSLNPKISLNILKQLKKPKTLRRLTTRLRAFPQNSVQRELRQLIENRFVQSLDNKVLRHNVVINPIIKSVLPDAKILSRLSQQVWKTRVGVIDVVGAADVLRDHLAIAGFGKINVHAWDQRTLGSGFIKEADVFVVVGASGNRIAFSKINQLLRPHAKHWLLVMIDSMGGTIGPTFGVEGGPCYDCILDHSKRTLTETFRNSDYEDLIDSGSFASDPGNLHLGKNIFPLAAVELVKIASRVSRPRSFDGFHSLDMFNFRMRYSPVSPSPCCPVCSGETL
jgi:bacteriocin biosynthesis cyclodehydratase domain-containing protein